MTTELIFHGGAGTVTGSCYELVHAGSHLLIDCGMFQGNKTLRELNDRPFPFKPDTIDAVLLTHAHIDHAGLLPKLCKNGFSGQIHATAPTIDLCAFMLPDSGHIQESETERINRRNRRRGKPPLVPVYTQQDAEACLDQMAPVPLERWFTPAPGFSARLWNAGHILGSTSIEIKVARAGQPPLHVLFSGDLGPDEKVFHPEPEAPAGFDYVLCESTYGDRDRADATVAERRDALCREILAAHDAGGLLLIPAFAVERTQELLHDLGVLLQTGQIPPMPVYLDSPLANKATRTFIKHASALEDIEIDEDQLFKNPHFHFVESVEESKAINEIRGQAIVLAASGMCEAGRIRHHLRNHLWQAETTVLFVGYQAPGALGHLILEGRPSVQIHGREVAINARIRAIGNYSAHADQRELIAWIKERLPVRAGLFLTHGEDHARSVLREHLIAEGLPPHLIVMPALDQKIPLSAAPPVPKGVSSRIDPADLAADWYGDYAELMLRLGRHLESLPDNAARRRLLLELKAHLPSGI